MDKWNRFVVGGFLVALLSIAAQIAVAGPDLTGPSTAPVTTSNADPEPDPAGQFINEFQARHRHTVISEEMMKAAIAQCQETYWGVVSRLDQVCIAGVRIGKRYYELPGNAMDGVLAECARYRSGEDNACFVGAYFAIGRGPRMWSESPE